MSRFGLSGSEAPLWLQRILDLVFPPYCVACRRVGAWLCADCLAEVAPLDPSRCPTCGRATPWPGICPSCRQTSSYLVGLYALSAHRYPLREAVHALKYQGVRVLAPLLGRLLAEYWQRQGAHVDLALPVPLHPRRERWRGYNQSCLLAACFASNAGLPLGKGLLERTRETRAQVGLSAKERWANMEGAFAVRAASQAAIVGQRVLLIDDVYTTGATLEACAQALLHAGAETVRALTLTRALDDTDVVRNTF
ncbi:MAG: ComF family protein [Chloroflexi bacterium]|nr:ComF family protein [Chloroflexota bacterium]